MKKSILLMIAIGGLFLASCTSVNKSMREPMTRVELYADDFDLSQQVSASAQTTRILLIDFARLFKKESGSVNKDGGTSISLYNFSVPVIGDLIADPTAGYALYNLMEANQGYDVIFYPQYKTKVVAPILGMGFIMSTTTVDVSARLGKFK
ncbi:MAG: hypothetical protein WEC59_13190 [Salibacteraceae bacterium]